MKYIRTKDGKIIKHPHPNAEVFTFRNEILKTADTIKELCDDFVGIRKSNQKACTGKLVGSYWFEETGGWIGRLDSYESIYGAIWVKGVHDEPILKSVAKMKGVLSDGEIDWELLWQ